jgi:hypothetical protein
MLEVKFDRVIFRINLTLFLDKFNFKKKTTILVPLAEKNDQLKIFIKVNSLHCAFAVIQVDFQRKNLNYHCCTIF